MEWNGRIVLLSRIIIIIIILSGATIIPPPYTEALTLSTDLGESKMKRAWRQKHNNGRVATASSQPIRGRCKNGESKRCVGPLSRNQRENDRHQRQSRRWWRDSSQQLLASRRWSSPSGFRRASVVSCHDVSDRVGISFPKNSSVLSYNYVRIDDYNAMASSWFHSIRNSASFLGNGWNFDEILTRVIKLFGN